jgi:FtsZ-interacting cell division protein ZipA
MTFGGFGWSLLTIVGAIVLLVVIAWAMLRNRSSKSEIDRSEEATRRNYAEEDRAHHSESDNVP